MKRLEVVILAFFFAGWVVAGVGLSGWADLAGTLDLSLYSLYTTAAALGWLFGNVFLVRGRGAPRRIRRLLLRIYFFSPPGLIFLLRALAPEGEQSAAPLVPIFAFGVYAVLFSVPVALKRESRSKG